MLCLHLVVEAPGAQRRQVWERSGGDEGLVALDIANHRFMSHTLPLCAVLAARTLGTPTILHKVFSYSSRGACKRVRRLTGSLSSTRATHSSLSTCISKCPPELPVGSPSSQMSTTSQYCGKSEGGWSPTKSRLSEFLGFLKRRRCFGGQCCRLRNRLGVMVRRGKCGRVAHRPMTFLHKPISFGDGAADVSPLF